MTMKMSSMFSLLFFALYVSISLCDHYVVKDKNNMTCIILDSAITGVLHYTKVDNSTEQLKFNITGRADGSCNGIQHIKIRFGSYFGREDSILTIYFKQKDGSFQISNFTLAVYFKQKLNATELNPMYVMDEHAELDVSSSSETYKCSKAVLSFREGSTVTLHNVRLTAYAHLNVTEFPENQEYDICQLDVRTSDLVPIVVGVFLAALVIIVLIAYLVGRARAKRQGYASV